MFYTYIYIYIYGKIIKKFLEQEFVQIETEEQAGFRAGRSTVDHIFCLKQLIEKKMAVDQPLTKLNSVASVRERTIPTERPPPVGEVSANLINHYTYYL